MVSPKWYIFIKYSILYHQVSGSCAETERNGGVKSVKARGDGWHQRNHVFQMQHTLDHFLMGGSFFKLWLPSLALVYSLVSIGPPIKEGISQAALEPSSIFSIFREACEGELALLEIFVTHQTLRLVAEGSYTEECLCWAGSNRWLYAAWWGTGLFCGSKSSPHQ